MNRWIWEGGVRMENDSNVPQDARELSGEFSWIKELRELAERWIREQDEPSEISDLCG
jgi:hypothetical protein